MYCTVQHWLDTCNSGISFVSYSGWIFVIWLTNIPLRLNPIWQRWHLYIYSCNEGILPFSNFRLTNVMGDSETETSSEWANCKCSLNFSCWQNTFWQIWQVNVCCSPTTSLNLALWKRRECSTNLSLLLNVLPHKEHRWALKSECLSRWSLK